MSESSGVDGRFADGGSTERRFSELVGGLRVTEEQKQHLKTLVEEHDEFARETDALRALIDADMEGDDGDE